MTGLFTPASLVRLAGFCFLLANASPARAASITLFAAADATLIEFSASNTLGAASWFSAGITQNGNTNRALLKFDVAGALPAGATITFAGLYVWVTRDPIDGYAETSFSLRRMLRPWGEGPNGDPPSNPGYGQPAQPGDATWTHAFWETNAWTIPGGLEGVDYSESPSITASIGPESSQPYFFEGGDATTDAQFWLDHPEQNFGWMLRSDLETGLEARFTARRFGSRELEDPNSSPQMIIDYLPPMLITNVSVASNQIAMSFPTDFGYSYRIEWRPACEGTNAWNTLTNFGLILSPGPRTATDSLSNVQRFYRLRRD
jgi:hypothetical protein